MGAKYQPKENILSVAQKTQLTGVELMVNNQDSQPGATMHPSGLTLARWHFPFKTPAERAMIVAWLNRNNFDDSIPF